MNAMLDALNEKKELLERRNAVMAVYKLNLKRATIDSVKCMHQEYIRRKKNTLPSLEAEACFREMDLEQFFTPSKSSNSSTTATVEQRQDVTGSPLATPLE